MNQHLEKNPNAVTPEQKEGFFSWLFSNNNSTQAEDIHPCFRHGSSSSRIAEGKPAAAPIPPKLNDKPKPAAPTAAPQRPQSQVCLPSCPSSLPSLSQPVQLMSQPSLYPSNALYRYPTGGMQVPPGMQIATIPPGAPIPPGAVPLNGAPGLYPGLYASATPQQQQSMYFSQLGQP